MARKNSRRAPEATAQPDVPVDQQIARLRDALEEDREATKERFVAAEVNANSNYRRVAMLETQINAMPAKGSPAALIAAITASILSPAPDLSRITAEFSADGDVSRVELSRYPSATGRT